MHINYLEIVIRLSGLFMGPATTSTYRIQCVHRKGLESAVCDTIYTIYLALSTHTADPNPFRVTYCIRILKVILFPHSYLLENIKELNVL